jgi:ribosomal-protein-alanine N-acetyltransferase
MLPDDVGEVKALLDACFGSSAWSEQSILSELEKSDSYCTVAVKDGVIVGYLAFEQIADEGSIIEVAVRPDCRRQGIAKRLIESASDSSEGLSEVFLEVRESNIPAVALYEGLGFERIALRRDYYDAPKENAIIMRKVYENSCD